MTLQLLYLESEGNEIQSRVACGEICPVLRRHSGRGENGPARCLGLILVLLQEGLGLWVDLPAGAQRLEMASAAEAWC